MHRRSPAQDFPAGVCLPRAVMTCLRQIRANLLWFTHKTLAFGMRQRGTRLVGGRQLVVVPGVESGVERQAAAELAVQGSHGGGAEPSRVGGVDERRIVHIGRVG